MTPPVKLVKKDSRHMGPQVSPVITLPRQISGSAIENTGELTT